jgi:heat shock protein HslJ
MRHRALLFRIGMTAMLVACVPGSDDTANGGLANTSWTVISIGGQDTLPEARPTMTFAAGGTVAGSGGCNQYSGAFRTDGDRIAFGQVSSTLMGCEGPRGQQEAVFLKALDGAATWRQIENGELEIGGNLVIVARPGIAIAPLGQDLLMEEPAAALAGTSWTLTDLGGMTDFVGLVPTLEFAADGTVAGFTGCNRFHGPYAVAGGDLKIGNVVTTKMACPRASEVEGKYLEWLPKVSSWSLAADGRLTLDGPVSLTFVPG